MHTEGVRLFSMCCSREMTLQNHRTTMKYVPMTCLRCWYSLIKGWRRMKVHLASSPSIWNLPEQSPCFLPSLSTTTYNCRTCESAASIVISYSARCWQLHLLSMLIYYTADLRDHHLVSSF